MKTIFFLVFSMLMGISTVHAQTEPVNTPSTETVAAIPVTATEAAPAESVKPAPAVAPAESEIPLHLDAEKKSSNSDGLLAKILYSLVVLTLLGAGLFYLVRKYSIPRNSAVSQTTIKVLSQHHFGPKRSLALVRVAGESILIGITDQNINLVKSLSLLDEDVPEEIPQNFNKTLDRVENRTAPASDTVLTNDEEFAISGIKDIVQKKLRSMRNFQ